MATEIFREPDKYEIIGGKKVFQLGDNIAEGMISVLDGFKVKIKNIFGWFIE